MYGIPNGLHSDERPQFILRFPTLSMRKEIKAQAALNGRSMNSELIYLIQLGREFVASRMQGAAA